MEFKKGDWVVIEGYSKMYDGALCELIGEKGNEWQLRGVRRNDGSRVYDNTPFTMYKRYLKPAPLETDHDELRRVFIDMALDLKNEDWFLDLTGRPMPF